MDRVSVAVPLPSPKSTDKSGAGILHGINSRRFLWHRYGLASAAAFSVVLLIPLVYSSLYPRAISYTWKISTSPTGGERLIGIGNFGGTFALTFDDSFGGPFELGPLEETRRGPFSWWIFPRLTPWDDFRKALWFFAYDRHTFAAPVRTKTAVDFPAWMLIVLCGIAPSLWLRRHLRHRAARSQRGFAVEPGNGA